MLDPRTCGDGWRSAKIEGMSLRSMVALVSLAVATALAAEAPDLSGVLAALGYKVKVGPETEPSAWELQTFQMLGKRRFELRSRTPMDGVPDTYPRFVLIEESYSDATHAAARLERLSVRPPGLSGEQEKIFPLRKGMARDARVLLVTTDAVLFEPELGRLLRRLDQALNAKP
jgi:hypothetical protein